MPIHVEPRVYLISSPQVDWKNIERFFDENEFSHEWLDRWMNAAPGEDVEALDEFAARYCYQSYEVGEHNLNLTQVRTDSEAFFENIKSTGHGSVIEHGMFSFAIHGISRVMSHELVRHRAGTAFSQLSMRYVRLSEMPFWFPEWALEDDRLMERCWAVLEVLENHQKFMSVHFGLEEDPEQILEQSPLYQERGSGFGYKKFITSFMRRFSPQGVAAGGMVFSCNARALRHIISMRTAESAEEEIRMIFREIAQMMIDNFPLLFGDFKENDKGEFTTPYWKI